MQPVKLVLAFLKPSTSEGLPEKLNYYGTPLITAILWNVIYYVAQRDNFLSCGTPTGWSSQESECYSNLYYVSNNSTTKETNLKEQRNLSFYQNVIFFGLLPLIPHILPHYWWRYISSRRELSLNDFINKIISLKIRLTFHKSSLYHVTNTLAYWLRLHSGSRLVFWHICVKLIYAGLALAQLEFMALFFAVDRWWAMNIITNKVDSLVYFPKTGVCHLSRRVASGKTLNTFFYCNLTGMKAIEIVYLVLWSFFAFLLIINLSSALLAVRKWMTRSRREKIVRNHMHGTEESMISSFIQDFLQWDGLFIVEKISLNCDSEAVHVIIRSLYEEFLT